MPRINIVIGYSWAGEPSTIYAGFSGEAAQKAFAQTSPDISRVELFRYPEPSRVRKIAPVLASPTYIEKSLEPAEQPVGPTLNISRSKK